MAVKPPSKTQVLNSIAEQTGLKKQDVISVLDSLTNQISASINGEAGAFTIPGLCKIVRQIKPATPEREMKSPFTGEMITVSAIVFSVTAANFDNPLLMYPLMFFAVCCILTLLFACKVFLILSNLKVSAKID